jgi:lipopolysaccharide heptosyltransferase II
VSRLQIPVWRERALVAMADLALAPLALAPRPAPPPGVRRVLLLRLERIGDLLMTLDAIRLARSIWPSAEIDLIVGRWNLPLAELIADVTRVEAMTVPWLAREGGGDSWRALVATARLWATRRYDVAINFEPDIRSNFLMWWSNAAVRAGYSSSGGAAFLTHATTYDPAQHVGVNACALVERVALATSASRTSATAGRGRLALPSTIDASLPHALDIAARPLIGIHTSGGRESKQWDPDRFAEVARRLVSSRGGTVVLTGAHDDRSLVDRVQAQLGGVPVVNMSGATGLVALASVLAKLDVIVTGDTGPMHLASAVGTPVVALFGPSDPARYGPRARSERILTAVDVPCRPCGRVRLPPTRCRGHIPDCMNGISVDVVVSAALTLLDEGRARPPLV